MAVDASLSVPYIANLENGRGNPTLSALQQLAAALGTRLEIGLRGDDGSPDEPEVPEAVRRLMASPRALAVARQLARRNRTDVSIVTERLQDALIALAAVAAGELDERDLDRLLDLLLLARAGLEKEG
ncbi:helix-turn-helix domain-containing protein [Streptomyces sp. NPDC002896]|uniref:helix-turn-helix domain-containing protein n=1 Tax=Streptomyces sp. NPDC002896 TaxID=3154438 RepID=UPI00331F3215